MTRKLLSSKEITEKVQSLVNQLEVVQEDNATVIVGSACWNELDANGSNWHISTVQNGTAYVDAITKIIESVKSEVNIVEP